MSYTIEHINGQTVSLPLHPVDSIRCISPAYSNHIIDLGLAYWPAGAGMPSAADARACAKALTLANGTRPRDGKGQIYDRNGIGINGIRRSDGSAYDLPVWAPILLDIIEGHIIVDHAPTASGDAPTIYRRDEDQSARGIILPTWHVCSDVQAEIGIPTQKRMRNMDRWVAAVAAHAKIRMLHAVRIYVKDGWRLWMRGDDGIIREWSMDTAPADIANSPAEVELAANGYDIDELVAHAKRVCEWLAVDADSAYNLSRLWATPILEEYGILSYILYGAGGNGKSLLLGELVKRVPQAVATDIATLISRGYDKGDELAKLSGSLWAVGDEAPVIDYDHEPTLKQISSHSIVRGRIIGHAAFAYRSRCTMIYCTNEPPIESGNASYTRRYSVVQLVDGRALSEFQPLVKWLQDGPGIAALIAYSCRHWGGLPMSGVTCPPDGCPGSGSGTTHKEVHVTDATSSGEPIADVESALVTAILTTATTETAADGYMLSTDLTDAINAARLYGKTVRKQILQATGTKVRTHRVDGVPTKCIMRDTTDSAVKRWESWVARIVADLAEDDASVPAAAEQEQQEQERTIVNEATGEISTVPAPPAPLTADEVRSPDEAGFVAKYVAGDTSSKVVKCWKQRDGHATAEDALVEAYNNGGSVYAVVPAEGYAVMDCDVDKDDEEDGWSALCSVIGGTPATYMTRTPSGGVHVYYRLPDGLHLRSSVAVGNTALDIRADGKAYVVGPNSHTDAGDYLVADDRDVAMMPQALVDWLRDNGAVEGSPRAARKAAPRKEQRTPVAQDQPTGLAALSSVFGASGSRSGNRGLDRKVDMGRSTHDEILRTSFAQLGTAAEEHWEQPEIDALVIRLVKAVTDYRDQHDIDDTRLSIETALDMHGITTTVDTDDDDLYDETVSTQTVLDKYPSITASTTAAA